MKKYNIFITKEKTGLFSAFSIDYPIAIEEESEEKAFNIIKGFLYEYIISDIKSGKKLSEPKSFSFESMDKIISEYKLMNNNFLVKQVSYEELFKDDAFRVTRINISLPLYLKEILDNSNLKASKLFKTALEKELGLI